MAIWVAARGGCGRDSGSTGRSPNVPRSAAANSPQVAYLSSGDLAIALAMTWSIAGGRPARLVVSGGGGVDSWANITASPPSRRNGGAPASISKAAQASAYRSVRPSTGRPSICSGAT